MQVMETARIDSDYDLDMLLQYLLYAVSTFVLPLLGGTRFVYLACKPVKSAKLREQEILQFLEIFE